MNAQNLALWQSVEKTDPKHTKQVTQRGGFTSIDAYYQFQRATEKFGPLGTGWGYDADWQFHDDLVVCTVRLWYVLDGNRSEAFPVCAMNEWRTLEKSGKTRLDDDAAKKALTDALTKALSYLGFSADVFMGKYDDNKYVAKLRREMAEADQPAPPPSPPAAPLPDDIEAELVRLETQIAEARDENELAVVSDGWRSWVTENAATYPAIGKRAAAAKARKQKEIVNASYAGAA